MANSSGGRRTRGQNRWVGGVLVASLVAVMLPPTVAVAQEGEGEESRPDVTEQVSNVSPVLPWPASAPDVSTDGETVVYTREWEDFDYELDDLVVRKEIYSAGRWSTEWASGWSPQRETRGNGDSDLPAVTGAGQFVAFVSDADNLFDGWDAAPDTNGRRDVYVQSLLTYNTPPFRASVDLGGGELEAGAEEEQPAVAYVRTGERVGTLLVVYTTREGIVEEDTNDEPDVYLSVFDVEEDGDAVWNVELREVVLASGIVSDGGAGTGVAGQPALSPDGQWLAFRSDSDLREPEGSLLSSPQVWLRKVRGDVVDGAFEVWPGDPILVSSPDGEAPGGGPSAAPSVSDAPDGGESLPFVAFASSAPDLVDFDVDGVPVSPPDAEALPEVYRWHQRDGGEPEIDWVTERREPGDPVRGRGNTSPAVTADGRYVAYASDLVLSDSDWPETGNVFRRDMDAEGDGVRREPAEFARYDGADLDYDSDETAVSGDGAVVVFSSEAEVDWGEEVRGPYRNVYAWAPGHDVGPEPGTFAAAVNVLTAEPVAGSPTAVRVDFVDPTGSASSGYSYAIDWGDGSDGSFGGFDELAAGDPTGVAGTTTADHTYASEGSYTITAFVIDESVGPDRSAVGTTGVTVAAAPPAPVLSVGAPTFDPAQPVEGEEVTVTFPFSDTVSRSPYTATVSWGDGTNHEATVTAGPDGLVFSASHTYRRSQPLTVRGRVTATDGVSAHHDQPVTVLNVAPQITALDVDPASGAAPLAVSLDATFTDPGWDGDFVATVDWGDGTVESSDEGGETTLDVEVGQGAIASTHTYATPGDYTPALTVADGTDEDTQEADTVTVTPAASQLEVRSADPTDPDDLVEGREVTMVVQFVDSIPFRDPRDEYEWEILWEGTGGGPVSDGVENVTWVADAGYHEGEIRATHTYRDDGSFPLTVRVREPGAADPVTLVRDVDVANADPVIGTVTLDHDGGTDDEVTLTVEFTDPGIDDHHTMEVAWDDGAEASADIEYPSPGAGLATATHTYDASGDYEIAFTVADEDGGSVSDTVELSIESAGPVTANLGLEVQGPAGRSEPPALPGSTPPVPTAPVEVTAGSKAVPIAEIPPEALLGPPRSDTVDATPLRAIDVSATPLRAITLESTPLRAIPLRAIPLRAIPLRAIQLSGVPVDGGWEALLKGTSLEGLPLQTLTLEDVADLSPSPLDSLTLGQVGLASTPLRAISLASIAMGSTPLRAIPLRAIAPEGDPDYGWCDLLASLGYDCAELGINEHTSTLMSLEIAGVPLRAIPLRAIPLRAIPLRAIDLESTPLRAIPLRAINLAVTPLRAIPLRAIGNLDDIVDCRAFDCADPDATLGDAWAAQALREGATLYELFDSIPEDVTLAEVLLGLLPLEDYPWEQLALDELGVQDFAPAHTPPLRFAAWLDLTDAGGTTDATVEIDLPRTFRYAGDAVLRTSAGNTVPEAVVDGDTLRFELADLPVGDGPIRLAFDVHPGLLLGEHTADARITVGDGDPVDAAAVTPVTVTEHFAGDEPEDAEALDADVLYLSHISSPGDVDYFAVPAPPAGQRLSVTLSNLGADGDLVLYSPVESAPLRAIPLRAIPLRAIGPGDDGAGYDAPNIGLEPETLRDIPLRAIPLRAISANRDTADEHVEVDVSPSDVGKHFLVQVSGYNGSSSERPYVVRTQHRPSPPPPTCTTGLGAAGPAGQLPADLADADTLFVLNAQRIRATHGEAALTAILDALAPLLGDQPDLGIHGAIVPVDAYASVRSAYAAWDAPNAGCEPANANAVVDAVNAQLVALRAANPDVRNVVLVGGDDLLPMARLVDATRLSNERDYADGVGDPNPIGAAFATEHILSDNPFGSSTSLETLDRRLYVPDVAVGRLVESPADIAAQLALFAASDGRLDPTTALTSGYDFLTDGAEAVDAALARRIGEANRSTLIDETWSRSDLGDALFPLAGDSPDIASVNAHFDHYRALPADEHAKHTEDDLFTVDDVAAGRLDGRLLFSMGCHSGLALPDSYVGSRGDLAPDWPQRFSSERAIYVANTGFGYGDTEAVALSERLMELFAEGLGGELTVGDALTVAKQRYSGEMGLYGPYDEKIMQESTLFGLPMYRIGAAPDDGGDTPTASAASVTSSSAPAGTVLDAATGLPVAPSGYRSIVGPSRLTERITDRGTYWTVGDEHPQVTHWRPIQPRTVRDVTQPGLDGRGVLVTGLVSTDRTDHDGVFARPTTDLAAHEPEVEFGGVAFPAHLAALNRTEGPAGTADQLVLVPGRFVSDLDSGSTRGTQRLFTRVDALVYYGEPGGMDVTPPEFSRAEAVADDDAVAFAVDVTDPDGGSVKRALVLFKDASGGTWKPVELAPDGAGRWTGSSAAAVGDPDNPQIEWFAQAVDAAGNVGATTNKGMLFPAEAYEEDPADPAPAPQPGSGPQAPTMDGELGPSGWWLGGVTLTFGSSQAVTVDGSPVASGHTISDEGVHQVVVTAGGTSATYTVGIDTSDPSVTIDTPADGQRVAPGAPLAADFSCSDAASGVALCTGAVGPTGQPGTLVRSGEGIDTSTVGSHTLTVTAVDRAGRSSTRAHTFVVEEEPGQARPYAFSRFRPPVDAPPVLNRVKAGATVPVKWQVEFTDAQGGHNADLVEETSVTWAQIPCPTGGPTDTVTEPGAGTVVNEVRWDPEGQQYMYQWRTDRSWARSRPCMELRIDIEGPDGTPQRSVARFSFS